MTQSTYINELLEMKSEEPEISEIVEFYSGCNVLITDGSDFLNKLIIEKLLRSNSNIQRLFILIKPKPGVTYKERLKSLFDDKIYERLHQEQPDFKSQVTLIESDTTSCNLGLSSTSRDFLLKNINVVIHKPTVIRNDDVRLRRAINVNVKPVKLILQLATEMTDLKAFVYVSSAFSHYTNNYVNERFYKTKNGVKRILSLIDVLEDNLLNFLTPRIIGKWPNVNTFCQSLAEELIQIYGSRLPICVVRSPIILSTYKEPFSGYIDDSHEINKSLASIALGMIHVLKIDGKCTAEVLPADYVVNNVLAAAWDIHKTWNSRKYMNTIIDTDPLVYNCVSSCQNPINWNNFLELNQNLASKEPSIMTMWYHFLVLVNHKWLYKIYNIFLHMLPAAIIDTVAKHKNLKFFIAYEKVNAVNEMFTYYGSKQWIFDNSHMIELWNKMSPVDRKKFDFNVNEFDWEEYVKYYVRGLRVYFFKDPMTSLEKARIKYSKLKIAHYVLMTFFALLFLFIIRMTIYNY